MEAKDPTVLAVNAIEVIKCDNELYLLASNGFGSAELLHYKSGHARPVKADVYPWAILTPGEYDLTIIGINWGLKSEFELVVVTTDGQRIPFVPPQPSHGIGVVWTQTVKIRVAIP